jgi:hypothetical protein
VCENRVLRRIFESEREKVDRKLEKTAWCGISKFVLFAKYYWGDQMKEGEMEEACSLPGRNEKCMQNFGQKT